jgi:hypothetical protein
MKVNELSSSQSIQKRIQGTPSKKQVPCAAKVSTARNYQALILAPSSLYPK